MKKSASSNIWIEINKYRYILTYMIGICHADQMLYSDCDCDGTVHGYLKLLILQTALIKEAFQCIDDIDSLYNDGYLATLRLLSASGERPKFSNIIHTPLPTRLVCNADLIANFLSFHISLVVVINCGGYMALK